MLNQSLALFNAKDFIRGDIVNFIYNPAGPVNLDQIYLRSLLKSEMHSQIALRKITAAAVQVASLGEIAGNDFDSRANAVAIAFHSHCLDQNGIAGVAAVVSQQLRRAIKIIDHDVDVTVVIDVTKGGAATGVLFAKWG